MSNVPVKEESGNAPDLGLSGIRTMFPTASVNRSCGVWVTGSLVLTSRGRFSAKLPPAIKRTIAVKKQQCLINRRKLRFIIFEPRFQEFLSSSKGPDLISQNPTQIHCSVTDYSKSKFYAKEIWIFRCSCSSLHKYCNLFLSSFWAWRQSKHILLIYISLDLFNCKFPSPPQLKCNFYVNFL
jgi:hypothetical protein